MADQFNIQLISERIYKYGDDLQILDEFGHFSTPSNDKWTKLGTFKVPSKIRSQYDLRRSRYHLSLDKRILTLVQVITGH